jgi:hypothetical protein
VSNRTFGSNYGRERSLELAVRMGLLDTVNILLAAGANPCAQQNACLFDAINYGFANIVKILLNWGLDPSEELNIAINIAEVSICNERK